MMQNPHVPQDTPHDTDLLFALCEEIEVAWNARRDGSVVDRLAAAHAEHAGALYEFFALLIQAELDLDQPDPALAEHDARAKRWLESGGYAEVADTARREADLQTPTPGANVGAHMPPSLPARIEGHPRAQTPPVNVPWGAAEHIPGDPPEIATPAADSPAAGIVVGHGRTHTGSPSRGTGPRRVQPRGFLGLLIDTTCETPHAIASRLGVNANFLIGIDALGDRLPIPARQEFARRAATGYGLPHEQLLDHLGGAGAMPMAASRTNSYDRQLTYDEVVRHSKMPPGDAAFWLSLTDSPSSPLE